MRGSWQRSAKSRSSRAAQGKPGIDGTQCINAIPSLRDSFSDEELERPNFNVAGPVPKRCTLRPPMR